MCGVVSIVYGKHNKKLGQIGSELLKKLEYRGYDSTGGAFFKKDGSYTLKKKVGAPSKVTELLEMPKLSGVKFIGQVRWATFGSVTDDNAQPHKVNCFAQLVGGHNGNIANTDSLKEFLKEQGHNIVSDNDGEMLVHLIEHYYSILQKNNAKKHLNEEEQVQLLLKAIIQAEKTAKGSYAACITLPSIQGVFAIKSGSSLYAGKGEDENGEFIVVSSDLTSVLSKTRHLIPLSEGECIYFTNNCYTVYSLSDGKPSTPPLTRSRLNIADISLAPKYHYYMEQEIYSIPQNINNMLKYYFIHQGEEKIFKIFEKHKDKCREYLYKLVQLYNVFDKNSLISEFEKIIKDNDFQKLFSQVRQEFKNFEKRLYSVGFTSEEAPLLDELLGFDETKFKELVLFDQMLIWKKKRIILKFKEKTINLLKSSETQQFKIFVVASGTSYHAALTGAYFFNNLSNISVIAANPGEFRSMFSNSVKQGDIVIGVSQSGETKDLVDIFGELIEKYGDTVTRITIVNNENSTLPQEKSTFYLPVMCGPEIAVAATKSFISQLALFYILAAGINTSDDKVKKALEKIQYYLNFTLNSLEPDINEVALNLFSKPSMHILGTSLIGIAKEGALKVREVVLNHTEGYDAAEFKHGPNTILGKNTIFSLKEMETLVADVIDGLENAYNSIENKNKNILKELTNTTKNFKLRKIETSDINTLFSDTNGSKILYNAIEKYAQSLNIENYFSNYPLIFVCPPDERDIRITISQIHTHKIRGADIILIAEDDDTLEKAVKGKPAAIDNYYFKYIKVPKTNDKNMFVFEATVILQLIALEMSIKKMKYLNKCKIENHGVHPDVPKNVSKSITVD
jgi:glucosamine 6-phosphate synthetase-like amidotransferase/phosphosugar isomerase protein